jgi:hypothetical protein
MGYFLIDYENTKNNGLNGIETLSSKDTVCIFYSENANTLTFETHKKISESTANFVFQEVDVGTKNALDFQLVTYLGYLIGKDRNQKYFIVTKDAGFGSVAKFWAARNVSVTVVIDLLQNNVREEKEKLVEEVEKVIPDKEAAKVIADIIQRYKTKQGINNQLMKVFSSKKGNGEENNKKVSEYYKAIKPLIKDKKGK